MDTLHSFKISPWDSRRAQVNLFDKKGNLISTFIGKQDEMKIRKSINNLEKEEKPYEEIINAEFSTIQENKNNEVNPRSHG